MKPVKKESPAPAPTARARLDPSLATNLITAVVFLSVGFVGGYVFKSQMMPARPDVDSNVAAPQGSSASTPADASALPPGHPAIDTSPEVQAMEQQVAANPQDPALPLKLADYLYDHGSFEQAITWYQKATALDPNNVNASTDLGTCYFNVGRFDEALSQFRHSLTIEPQHQPTLFNVIVVNMEGKHDYKAAQKAYEALYKLNPTYPKLDELKTRLDEEAGPASPAQ